MRLRVLGVLGSLLCLIAIILSLLLLQSISRNTTQDVQLSRLAAVNRFVELSTYVQDATDRQELQLEMEAYSDLFDEGLLISVGALRFSSGGIDPLDAEVIDVQRRAALNLDQAEIPRISPFSKGSALISRPFGNSTQVLGSVIMEVNLDAARSQILKSWVIVVLVTSSVCAGLLLMAERLSAWVLRPISRLAEGVSKLAATQTPTTLQEAGPPELRALSRSFDQMAQSVTDSLNQQRELIAETSHQLRNPIAALRLRVDLLKMRLGEQPHQGGVAEVERELERVELLLDGVLRLASAEHRLSERSAHNMAAPASGLEPVIPAQLLTDEVERHIERSRETGTVLSLDLSFPESRTAQVDCNGFELRQIISEILENTFKYAPGQPVDLSIEVHAATVDLVILDHGPGLSDTQLSIVRDRFWRAEESRQLPGTGLGMAIVDRLVRANGGELFLASPPGGGLSVVIRLVKALGSDVEGSHA
ncbi:ATP-binding protein [Glutamicibacter sp. NPDC087344]|uniref:HAMP domain-containing sensor histidine kinase n=1 Tax=Glutamicibacter sp. NPDC087344 TaxID=3363994 RepID=UPI0037FA7FAF